MSGKKLVDFVKEYIDDSELLSELENIQLDDIRLNVERRSLNCFARRLLRRASLF